MQIEPATIDDVDAIAEQWLDLAAEQIQYGSHLRVSANSEPIRMALAKHVSDDTALVARAEGIVGFVSFEIVDGEVTQPAARGLTDEEREQYALTCMARPQSDLKLDRGKYPPSIEDDAFGSEESGETAAADD